MNHITNIPISKIFYFFIVLGKKKFSKKKRNFCQKKEIKTIQIFLDPPKGWTISIILSEKKKQFSLESEIFLEKKIIIIHNKEKKIAKKKKNFLEMEKKVLKKRKLE